MWVPLHLHSEHSLLDGLSRSPMIAKRCQELGFEACALTDHGSISGVPSFMKHLQKAGVKAIAGSEFYLCQQSAKVKDRSNAGLKHLCVLARNREGWKGLMRATSHSFDPGHFYRKQRLSLEELASHAGGNWIVFSGHPGSELGDLIWKDPRAAYNARTLEEAREQIDPDRAGLLAGRIDHYRQLFGKDNFWLEIQLIDHRALPASAVIASTLRRAGELMGVPCVATADSHYPTPEDAADQRVLLCAAMKITLKEAQRRLVEQEDMGLGGFFRSNRYHIPSTEEMAELHTPEELRASLDIASQCESYDIFGPPRLPVFDCPNGLSPDDYLRQLCREGWREKIQPHIPRHKHDQYVARVKYELDTIIEFGLSSYFLIVWDYCRWARQQGMLPSKGRGSAAGCMISYLIGITGADPLEYDLLFERFINRGRLSKERISLPDIDCDFPRGRRMEVVEYIRRKYGERRVSAMATFQRLQGRSVLKAVLRAHETCSYEEMNQITQFVPDESRISDELQQMSELGIQPSILRWALEHNREELSPYCTLAEDGSLDGPMAPYFAQAMRLEGVKHARGKHAAGIVISTEDLDDCCPMLLDKNTGERIAGFEMGELEALGLVKMDVLGLKTLDCLMTARDMLRGQFSTPAGVIPGREGETDTSRPDEDLHEE